MKREYYQDIGYKPFLFFVIYGVTGDDLEVSQKRHKVDELPEGLDLRTLTRELHGDYMDGFLTGPMGKVLGCVMGTVLLTHWIQCVRRTVPMTQRKGE